MLKQLYIKNFTLIDELNIPFHPGFSVITGETGAGKSIILGAIGLLLGQRADSKSIRQGQQRCVIEAHFDLSAYGMDSFFTENDIDYDPSDTIIRRELTAAGKSRGFINDTPVSLALMRQLGETLVDIHSQHQNLLLREEDFQLNVVDILAADSKQLYDYQQSFRRYEKAKRELEQLKEEIARSRENEEFMRFQFKEISDASLKDGEQEELEQENEKLSHSEEIKSALYTADNALSGEDSGVVERLRQAESQLRDVAQVYAPAGEIANRLNSSYIELKDLAQDVSSQLENIDFDPTRLDELSNRLDTIYSLEQKFHVNTIGELLAIASDLEEKLSHIDNSGEALEAKEKEMNALLAEAEKKAKTLTICRSKAAKKVEQEMKGYLVPLGIPKVRFEVSIQQRPLTLKGADKVSFMFSANTSTALRPVSEVASGGEIARVMLSLKAMISGAVKLPTIIFDEIDTGVSGKIAEKMATIMRDMGDHHRQVISITHLPQIAAMGTTHYRVSKEETAEGTVSHMTLLSPDERVNEIAQMLSGSDITEAAISNAKELLKAPPPTPPQ